MLAVATSGARGPILVAASSGLRRGEVFGLRWNDIDFDRRLIRVRSSNQDGEIVRPKTKAGERLVPMFGSLRQVLLEERARSPFKSPDDFVFRGRRRRPAQPERLAEVGVLPGAEEREGDAVPLPRPEHSRHFAVSQLIAQGANVLEVARVAGHADPSVTLRVYSHLMEGALAEAAARYDPLRVGAGGVPPSSSAVFGASGASPSERSPHLYFIGAKNFARRRTELCLHRRARRSSFSASRRLAGSSTNRVLMMSSARARTSRRCSLESACHGVDGHGCRSEFGSVRRRPGSRRTVFGRRGR